MCSWQRSPGRPPPRRGRSCWGTRTAPRRAGESDTEFSHSVAVVGNDNRLDFDKHGGKVGVPAPPRSGATTGAGESSGAVQIGPLHDQANGRATEEVVGALNGSCEAEPPAGVGDGGRVGNPGLQGDDGTTTCSSSIWCGGWTVVSIGYRSGRPEGFRSLCDGYWRCASGSVFVIDVQRSDKKLMILDGCEQTPRSGTSTSNRPSRSGESFSGRAMATSVVMICDRISSLM